MIKNLEKTEISNNEQTKLKKTKISCETNDEIEKKIK